MMDQEATVYLREVVEGALSALSKGIDMFDHYGDLGELGRGAVKERLEEAYYLLERAVAVLEDSHATA